MKPVIVVLRKATLAKARSFGFEDRASLDKTFLIIDFDRKILESTDSKKDWSSGDYTQMNDDAFFAIPILANEGDYVVEVNGKDLTFFTVKDVGETHYTSTTGLDYNKDHCMRIDPSSADILLSSWKTLGIM